MNSQNLRTKGEGEAEGEHWTSKKEKHLETYQYPDIGSAVKQPAPGVSEALIASAEPSQMQLEEHPLQEGLEELIMWDNNDNNAKMDTTTTTFEFQIGRGEAPMKNIPLSSFPSFQGMTLEFSDTFLFEFDVLCRIYDYIIDAQKLKLFPVTLKGAALRWFTGLGPTYISTWNDMKKMLLSKYQDYCRTKDLREEIFRMMQKEE